MNERVWHVQVGQPGADRVGRSRGQRPSMHVFGLLPLQFRRGFRVSPTRGRLGDELQGISAGPSVEAQGASHRPVSVLVAWAMATFALVNSDVGGGGECAR